jgi:hypothetical protein
VRHGPLDGVVAQSTHVEQLLQPTDHHLGQRFHGNRLLALKQYERKESRLTHKQVGLASPQLEPVDIPVAQRRLAGQCGGDMGLGQTQKEIKGPGSN